MAKVLVTGGKGFIGTNLVEELKSRGHKVMTCDIVHAEDENHIRAALLYAAKRLTHEEVYAA